MTNNNRARVLLTAVIVAAALVALPACSIGTSSSHGAILIVSTDLVPPNGSGGQQSGNSPAVGNFIVLGEPIDSSTTSTSISGSHTISVKHGFDLSLPDGEVLFQHIAN